MTYPVPTLEEIHENARSVDGRVVFWWTALDNHTPARNTATGYAIIYRNNTAPGDLVKLWDDGTLKDAQSAVYVVDDGNTATPYFVGGWTGHVVTPYFVEGYTADEHGRALYLHPFPTNPDGQKRPDNGREIDYSMWSMGPRRCYHLKITPVEED